MPRRVRNLTQIFKSSFASLIASIAILGEDSEAILGEDGVEIDGEAETVLGQGHSAGRLGGHKTAILPSTGGFSI